MDCPPPLSGLPSFFTKRHGTGAFLCPLDKASLLPGVREKELLSKEFKIPDGLLG